MNVHTELLHLRLRHARNRKQRGSNLCLTLGFGREHASGKLIDIQGGILTGFGTKTGSVRNSGTVNPGGSNAGRLTITGNHTQHASGAHTVDLGGLTA